MGLLRRRPRRGDELRGLVNADSAPSPALLAAFGSGPITAASASNPQRALAHSMVYRCTFLAADVVASLPVREVANGETAASSVVADPWPAVMTRSTWVATVVGSMFLNGAAALVAEGPRAHRGIASSLAIIDPARVRFTADDGWMLDGKPVRPWPEGELVYVPFRTLPGSPLGLSPLSYARVSIFGGLAAAEWSAGFFASGGVPSGLLLPDRDPGEQGAALLKAKFKAAAEGRDVAVLPQAVRYERVSVSPADSAFVEAANLSDLAVARFFGMPSVAVNGPAPDSGANTTYGNREALMSEVLQAVSLPMRRIEESWSSVIPSTRSVRFITAGALRADTAARWAAYRTAIETGVMTADEVRALEDLPPRIAA